MHLKELGQLSFKAFLAELAKSKVIASELLQMKKKCNTAKPEN